jgi:transposase
VPAQKNVRRKRFKRSTVKGLTASDDVGVRVPDTIYLPGSKGNSAQSQPAVLEIGAGAAEAFSLVAKKRSRLAQELFDAHRDAETNGDTPERKRARYLLRRRMNEVAIRLESLKHDLMVRRAAAIYSRTETLLFPKFDVGKMVRSKVLPPVVKRRMLSLGHCRFRHFLRHRALVQNKTLRIVTEHYTSQACPRCLKRNKLLGASKMFRCPFCKYQ